MTGPNDSTSWHTCLFPGDMSLCTYVVGDGVGGTEEGLGDANSESECVTMVRQMRPEANGATYSAPGTGTSCYAEFGMTESNGSASWQTCLFDNAQPDVLCGPGMGPNGNPGVRPLPSSPPSPFSMMMCHEMPCTVCHASFASGLAKR